MGTPRSAATRGPRGRTGARPGAGGGLGPLWGHHAPHPSIRETTIQWMVGPRRAGELGGRALPSLQLVPPLSLLPSLGGPWPHPRLSCPVPYLPQPGQANREGGAKLGGHPAPNTFHHPLPNWSLSSPWGLLVLLGAGGRGFPEEGDTERGHPPSDAIMSAPPPTLESAVNPQPPCPANAGSPSWPSPHGGGHSLR